MKKILIISLLTAVTMNTLEHANAMSIKDDNTLDNECIISTSSKLLSNTEEVNFTPNNITPNKTLKLGDKQSEIKETKDKKDKITNLLNNKPKFGNYIDTTDANVYVYIINTNTFIDRIGSDITDNQIVKVIDGGKLNVNTSYCDKNGLKKGLILCDGSKLDYSNMVDVYDTIKFSGNVKLLDTPDIVMRKNEDTTQCYIDISEIRDINFDGDVLNCQYINPMVIHGENHTVLKYLNNEELQNKSIENIESIKYRLSKFLKILPRKEPGIVVALEEVIIYDYKISNSDRWLIKDNCMDIITKYRDALDFCYPIQDSEIVLFDKKEEWIDPDVYIIKSEMPISVRDIDGFLEKINSMTLRVNGILTFDKGIFNDPYEGIFELKKGLELRGSIDEKGDVDFGGLNVTGAGQIMVFNKLILSGYISLFSYGDNHSDCIVMSKNDDVDSAIVDVSGLVLIEDQSFSPNCFIPIIDGDNQTILQYLTDDEIKNNKISNVNDIRERIKAILSSELKVSNMQIYNYPVLKSVKNPVIIKSNDAISEITYSPSEASIIQTHNTESMINDDVLATLNKYNVDNENNTNGKRIFAKDRLECQTGCINFEPNDLSYRLDVLLDKQLYCHDGNYFEIIYCEGDRYSNEYVVFSNKEPIEYPTWDGGPQQFATESAGGIFVKKDDGLYYRVLRYEFITLLPLTLIQSQKCINSDPTECLDFYTAFNEKQNGIIPNSSGNILKSWDAGSTLPLYSDTTSGVTKTFTFNTDIENNSEDLKLDGGNKIETIEFNGNNTGLNSNVVLNGNILKNIVFKNESSVVKINATKIKGNTLNITVNNNNTETSENSITREVLIESIVAGVKKINFTAGDYYNVLFLYDHSDTGKIEYKFNTYTLGENCRTTIGDGVIFNL